MKPAPPVIRTVSGIRRRLASRLARALERRLRPLPLPARRRLGALGLAQRGLQLRLPAAFLLLALAVRRLRPWTTRRRGGRGEQRAEAGSLELVLEAAREYLSRRLVVGGRGPQRVADTVEDRVARRAESARRVDERLQRVALPFRRRGEVAALGLRLAQRVTGVDEPFELL